MRVRGHSRAGRCLLLLFCTGLLSNLAKTQAVQPDLNGVSASERSMIESACSVDRQINGPVAYYNCQSRQLQALSNVSRPILFGISTTELSMIESACSVDRQINGPAAYYNCQRHQLQALSRVSQRPDWSGISLSERGMVESACNVDLSPPVVKSP